MRRILDIDGTLDSSAPSFSDEQLVEMYRLMLRTRTYDRRAMALQRQGRIGTYPPSEGHEATQIGAAMALGPDDWVYPAYREHGVELAMGMPIEVMLSYWRGIPNPEWNPHIYRVGTLTVPIGSHLPHAVGHAFESERRGQPIVTMGFLGDGTTSSNDFHSALTFAGVWDTPTVFVCQNNGWAISTPVSRQTGAAHLVDKAAGYGVEGVLVDGMDVLAVYQASMEAVERARTGGGSTFIEAVCYRLGPHATADDPSLYRSEEEVEQWRPRDPIVRLRRLLDRRGIAFDSEHVEQETAREVDEAITKIEQRPTPARGDAIRHAMVRIPQSMIEQMHQAEDARGEERTQYGIEERIVRPFDRIPDGPTTSLTMAEAISTAINEAMDADDRVVVLGEDVGATGGVFRITAGMLERHGAGRIIDTPLNESGIIGTAIGMAIGGGRPIAEIQFDGFVYPAMDQIVNHLGRLRYRSRGTLAVPVVVRMPTGAGIKAHEHHCDSPESYFVHTPGLVVVMPSNPVDAKGLFASALISEDPVLFLEPKVRYRAPRGEVPDAPYTTPLGVAAVAEAGTDVTVVTYGGMVLPSLKAAAQSDASVEVIDLRTLYPWDESTVLSSVAKTGRLVLVQEPPRTGGVLAEVAAVVAERGIYDLAAPIVRVAGFDTPMPHFAVEDHGLVAVPDILAGINRVLER